MKPIKEITTLRFARLDFFTVSGLNKPLYTRLISLSNTHQSLGT